MRGLTLAILALATFAAFAGVLRNGWVVFDDPQYVYANPHVNRGLTGAGLRWFLTEPHGGNWHPLTSFSHMLDVQVFGLDPAGHHAVSLALHLVNALLLALVLFRLTGAWWRSALVAGFFALHPLRVESVAWISERKDVLSGLFFLLTLDAYRRWAARPSASRYGLVIAWLALGLMSKPMLVTLPAVLVLVDLWPLGRLKQAVPRGSTSVPAAATPPPAPARSLGGLIAEKWPLFSIAAASAVVTFLVQRRGGAVAPLDLIPLGRRLANAVVTCWLYIGQTLWPRDLAVFYPYGRSIHLAATLIAAAGLVAATVLAIRAFRTRPYLAVGWLWYLGMLVPVLGLVQVGGQSHADRYTYLPAIGIALALVWWIADRVRDRRALRVTSAGLAVIALATLGIATARQVAIWRSTESLFDRVLVASRGNLVGVRMAHQNLGKALLEAGELRRAIPHLEASLGLAPGTEDSLRRALAANPAGIETTRQLAILLARENRVGEAVAAYRAILARAPGDLDALDNIAWMRATSDDPRQRDGAEAVRLAERVRAESPEPVGAIYSTLAAAYAEAGRYGDAVRACERAIQLARAGGASEEIRAYERQLARYREGKPFHFGE
ncbi:MAG TPA: hypothetical protein VMS88_07375 [Terriglobales bacterium]|nr:hypothetical protein [Terriglobales bacterium]